ncbi:MAG: efflux RND transporter periplasmic adaptor subunit [Luteolibacter sp.]
MKKRWIFLLLLLIAIAAAIWRARNSSSTAVKPAEKQAATVVLAKVAESDVPVWLTGIGTVQASNTVTVRPRTSGALDKVNFTEGAIVKEGDVLAQIDPRPYQAVLAQADAKKTQDQAQLANAVLAAERFHTLSKTDAISKQEMDQADASVAQLTALVKADNAAVQAAQLDLDLTTIRAPIAGRTGIRMIDAGNLVTANQSAGLVVLTQMQPVSVIFTLPEQTLATLSPHVRPDAPPLKVQALTDDGDVLAEGLLELIDNQIDMSTGTLRLKATFKNENLALWPGQFVSSRVLVEIRENAITVPTEAVQPGLDGQFCYVVKSDQTVEPRHVKTGLVIDGTTLIENGLKAGESIVVTGQGKLKPGAKVVAQKKAP